MRSDLSGVLVGRKRLAGLAVVLLSTGLFVSAVLLGFDKTARAAGSAQTQELPSGAVASNIGSGPVTVDDLLELIANKAPGFGGMYKDPADPDVLNVYLLDASRRDAAVAAIREFFGPDSIPPGGVKVLQGEYSINQLRGWYRQVRNEVWRRPTPVVRTDLAEQLNRIVVEVEDASAVAEIRDRVSRTSAPSDAVVVRVGQRAVPLTHTLESKFEDGRMGGIQIEVTGKPPCTGGFVADRSSTRGFTTAHHCTPTMGAVDSGNVYQPSSSFTPRVGVETVDPAFFISSQNPACPEGWLCRWSDSSFIQYDTGIASERGIIARPTPSGSINIDHNRPRFFISAEGSSVTIGDTLHKVGRASGWSQGSVDSIGSDESPDSLHLYLNQNIVAAGEPVGGDSGSPVFSRPTDPSSNEATLKGLLWGGSGARFIYAPLNNVYGDLGGTWDSCVPVYGC